MKGVISHVMRDLPSYTEAGDAGRIQVRHDTIIDKLTYLKPFSDRFSHILCRTQVYTAANNLIDDWLM